jgi:hypothetical protein
MSHDVRVADQKEADFPYIIFHFSFVIAAKVVRLLIQPA